MRPLKSGCCFFEKVSQSIRLTLLDALASGDLSSDLGSLAQALDQVTVVFHVCSPYLERSMGIEPTAFCLASRRSTSELTPHYHLQAIFLEYHLRAILDGTAGFEPAYA